MKYIRLLCYMLLAMLPIMLFRDYTPGNELRYLSIANEALSNGTWFSFSNHGIPYADKPPFYLWIVMIHKLLFGHYYMWTLSLFSLLPAWAIACLMDRWVQGDMDVQHRHLSWWMLLSCGLFTGMTIFLRMDMLMCLFITLALYSFYKGKQPWLFAISVFLAIFTKGPMGLLIPLTVTLIYSCHTRQFCLLGRYWGWQTWSILLGCCGFWFSMTYWEAGEDYLYNLLFHQTVDRAVNSFHHDKSFFYYGESIWYSLAPWSLFTLGVIIVSACKKYIHTPLQVFFMTMICTTWLLLSIISSKIAVYMMPVFPFMIYQGVLLLPRFTWNRWLALSLSVFPGILSLTFPAVIVVANVPIPGIQLPEMNGWVWMTIYVASAIMTVSAVLSLCQLYGRKDIVKSARTLSCGFLVVVFVAGWTLPQLNKEIGYGNFCHTLRLAMNDKRIKVPRRSFYSWGLYRAENMDVYLENPVQVLPSKEKPLQRELQGQILIMRKDKCRELPEDIQYEEICSDENYMAVKVQ